MKQNPFKSSFLQKTVVLFSQNAFKITVPIFFKSQTDLQSANLKVGVIPELTGQELKLTDKTFDFGSFSLNEKYVNVNYDTWKDQNMS